MEGENQPGGYGPSMTADQHRHRMQMMEFDERLRRMEQCIERLERAGESEQRGRDASGRFTSGPGRAGYSRSYEDDGSRSMGYAEGFSDGHTRGYYDGEQRGRGSRQYGRPSHMHEMDGYTGPAVPYYPPPGNEQHWRGYGHRGAWGYSYPDPMLAGYLIGAMQSEQAINV